MFDVRIILAGMGIGVGLGSDPLRVGILTFGVILILYVIVDAIKDAADKINKA